MQVREFWELMERINRDALDAGDDEGAVAPLYDALTAKSVTELENFEEILSQRLYALDGKHFADNAGDSGKSSDGFLYMRCYVVAKGRQFYLEVKSDPQRMPKSTEQWCEPLLYVCQNAWASITGRDASEWQHNASVSYETGSNKDLWNI